MCDPERADPPITVAIPTCNGARHLAEAVRSILRGSTHSPIILVDDRSEDDTVRIARDLLGDRGRVLVNSERLGLANNWNRCVTLSETLVVAIFHQDDVMLADHLAIHLAAYRRNPTIGWVASAATVIDQAGALIPESMVERGGLGDRDCDFAVGKAVEAFAVANPLRCSAVTVSRSAHAEVGGFDPSFRYVVDWDYWLRVAAVRPVAWRAESTVAIRWHPSSETHRFAVGLDDLDETARLLDQISGRVDRQFAGSKWRLPADRRLARAYLNRAHVAFKAGNPGLVRRALARSLRLSPSKFLQTLAADPRFLAQMGAALVAPHWVDRRTRSGRDAESAAG